jgi:integrase
MITIAGLPKLTIHGLRHTHASILMEKGVSPKVVSERLGHASPAITMDIYSHVSPDMQGKRPWR